ncbi:MAG: selenide, water dikinase SelD [Proteobacteria bacterium]|jgi:cysteine desulfurase|nr:selenide, water dikinase SelD [Pseudomonadota bacterium]
MSDNSKTNAPIRLTSLSHGAGCACKLSAKELATVLKDLPLVDDPRSLIDASTKDDAAVYKVSDDRAIVATLDFFTPIVDDPYTFGTIATANALSDVYAMAATPLFALSIVAWPRDPDMLPLLNKAMRGATDVAKQAGVFILGGHSIDDAEPKFGMVAIGEVKLADLMSNANAEVGDVLILTKPLGTGIMTTALKRDLISEEELQPAIDSMSKLNADAAGVIQKHRDAIHAVTDITGFGLVGHLSNMLETSGHSAQIKADGLPVIPKVKELIENGVIPGGTRRNHEAACEITQWSAEISNTDQFLMTDAQTSGGLLIAVDPKQVDGFIQSLSDAGTLVQAVIGEIIPRGEHLVNAVK